MKRSTELTAAAVALALLAGTAQAQDPAAGWTIEQPAAIAHVELVAETFGTTAAGAIGANRLAVARVVRALTQQGVAAEHIEAGGYSVLVERAPRDVVRRPLVPLRQLRERRVEGYRAISEIRVVTPLVDRVDLIVAAAVGAGAHGPLRVEVLEAPPEVREGAGDRVPQGPPAPAPRSTMARTTSGSS